MIKNIFMPLFLIANILLVFYVSNSSTKDIYFLPADKKVWTICETKIKIKTGAILKKPTFGRVIGYKDNYIYVYFGHQMLKNDIKNFKLNKLHKNDCRLIIMGYQNDD